MIIDATTGSPARFVNHSCQPNCRMIKWIVSGQPRMALFAGDRPIMTGEELTYDYNFDPFSAKNVQICLCGSPNCRGVLGPKPKEVKLPKAPKEDLKKTVKKGVNAGKRKLKEFIGDGGDVGGNAIKKRKIKTPTGVKAKGIKRSLSNASLKAARGAANVVKTSIKKSASSISVAKAAFGSKAAGRKIATVKRTSTVKTYSKTVTSKTPKKTASRNSSMTIVAAGLGSSNGKKRTPSSAKSALSKVDKSTPSRPVGRPRKQELAEDSPRQGLELSRSANQIRVVQSPGVEAA
jgi:histone-lysine N-methyltransferase ASH1L